MNQTTARVLGVLTPVLASALAVQFLPFSAPEPVSEPVAQFDSYSRMHLTLRELSLLDQVAEAGAIVRARVRSAETFVNERHDLVETAVVIDVLESFKGNLYGTATVTVAGGVHGRKATVVDFMPCLEPGVEAVMFLNTDSPTIRLLGRSKAVYGIAQQQFEAATVYGEHAMGVELSEFSTNLRSLIADVQTDDGGR